MKGLSKWIIFINLSSEFILQAGNYRVHEMHGQTEGCTI